MMSTPARVPRASPFRWIGGHPTLDFVNTAAWRHDGTVCAERLHHYFGLVAWGETAGIISTEAARALRARSVRHRARALRIVRDARGLRAVLRTAVLARLGEGKIDQAIIDTLDASLRAALRRRRLADDLSTWTWRAPARDLAGPLRAIVLETAALFTSDLLAGVRICRGAACGAFFLDASRGRGRRWCDMAVCGNRAKARRHRAAGGSSLSPSGRGR